MTKRIREVCPNCGKVVGQTAHYCSNCGYSLGEEEILYHYTSMDTVIALYSNIVVDEGERRYFHMRASDYRYMNDPGELHYTTNLLKAYVKREPLFSHKRDFDLDFLLSYSLDREFSILSLSYNKDDLDMWRSYSRNGTGVAIGFSKERLEEYLSSFPPRDGVWAGFDIFSLKRCRYLQENEIFSFIKKNEILLGNSLSDGYVSKDFTKFLSEFHTIKHPCYIREKEVRLIISNNLSFKHGFRNMNGIIVPFVEIPIPLTCVEKIVLGPCANPEFNLKSLSDFTKVRIEKSSLPYRIFK